MKACLFKSIVSQDRPAHLTTPPSWTVPRHCGSPCPISARKRSYSLCTLSSGGAPSGRGGLGSATSHCTSRPVPPSMHACACGERSNQMNAHARHTVEQTQEGGEGPVLNGLGTTCMPGQVTQVLLTREEPHRPAHTTCAHLRTAATELLHSSQVRHT